MVNLAMRLRGGAVALLLGVLAIVCPARGVLAQFGACCTNGGAVCVLTDAESCLAINDFYPGQACLPSPCAVGACCTGTQCTTTTDAACFDVWTAGVACSPQLCEAFNLAACCRSAGCSLEDPFNCVTTGGQPVGALCMPTTCVFGSCCRINGTCHMGSQAQCSAPSSFLGSQPCLPGVCDLGVCCSTDETCEIGFRAACAHFTSGITCTPLICQRVSCCVASQGCVANFSIECAAAGGVALPGACEPETCDLGACCGGANTCQVRVSYGCSGAWFRGETCVQATCFSGACCVGASCFYVFEGACRCPTCHYAGVGVACQPGNAVAPCCRADFDHSGTIELPDIFAYLASFFSGVTGADFNDDVAVTVQDIFGFLAAWFAGCP